MAEEEVREWVFEAGGVDFVPVWGSILLIDMQVRAHRKRFGDDRTLVVT